MNGRGHHGPLFQAHPQVRLWVPSTLGISSSPCLMICNKVVPTDFLFSWVAFVSSEQDTSDQQLVYPTPCTLFPAELFQAKKGASRQVPGLLRDADFSSSPCCSIHSRVLTGKGVLIFNENISHCYVFTSPYEAHLEESVIMDEL